MLLKQFWLYNLKQQQLIVQLNTQDQSQKKHFWPWLFVHQEMMSFKSCVQQEKEKLNCKFLNKTFKTFVSFKWKILPQLLRKSNHEEKNSPTYRSQKGVFVHSHQVTGKHLWPQHNFQKVISHKHSPLGVLKFSFHTEICVSSSSKQLEGTSESFRGGRSQYGLLFTLVLYIFTSLTIHDGNLCWKLCNFPKLAVCCRSLQHGLVWSD